MAILGGLNGLEFVTDDKEKWDMWIYIRMIDYEIKDFILCML